MAVQNDQKSITVQPNPQQGRPIQRFQGGWGRGLRSPFFDASPYEFFNSNPFSLMRRMSEEMDRMMESFGGDRESGDWSPAIEVSQREGKLFVQAELPGMTPEDVKVEVNNDSLVIRGERKSSSETNEGGVRRTERQYGSFYRSIPLPEGANADQAQAKFNNGILEITIPTPQQQFTRKSITIQSEGKPPASETKPAGSTKTQAA